MTNKEHVLFGRHSNISECCIKFFLTDWQTIGMKDSSLHRGKGYVRCFDCIKTNKIIKVHICNKRCVPFLKKIGRHIYAKLITQNSLKGH